MKKAKNDFNLILFFIFVSIFFLTGIVEGIKMGFSLLISMKISLTETLILTLLPLFVILYLERHPSYKEISGLVGVATFLLSFLILYSVTNWIGPVFIIKPDKPLLVSAKPFLMGSMVVVILLIMSFYEKRRES
ncbi:MAG: hypothetical protein H0Z18_04005 [Thermococcus sp.]|uniref:hypothetical protein n=1 Tax=Thermococcus sp. TaxID=35749 RepID=UPI001D78F1BC|nr:hypothetical protein [Thermococcus sp.]MBO8174402.1 hypothetical protein [Thermococcus sp.]